MSIFKYVEKSETTPSTTDTPPRKIIRNPLPHNRHSHNYDLGGGGIPDSGITLKPVRM